MTKLKNMFGLFVLVCALCFIPNVYATSEVDCGQDTAVAQIGDTCYTDLKEAMDLGGQVYVLKSTSLEVGSGIYITKDVELFLLDNAVITVNATGTAALKIQGATFKLDGNGTVTASGSNYRFAIALLNSTTGKDNLVSIGAGITLESTQGAVMFNNQLTGTHKLEVAGTIKAGNTGIYINGDNKIEGSSLQVDIEDGASLECQGIGIYQAGFSTFTIGEATITGATGIAIKSGTLTLNGTTVTATGDFAEPSPRSDGVNGTGAAIQVESNTDYKTPVNIKITGGTFTSENNVAFQEYTDSHDTTSIGEIEISGGTFDGKKGSLTTSENFKESNKDQFISGGTFLKDGANDPDLEEEFLAEHLVKNAQGEVVPPTVSVKVYDGTEKSTAKETKDMPYGANILEQVKDFDWLTKDGLTLEGWYYDDAFTQKVQDNDTVSDTTVTLYAHFVVTVYYGEAGEGDSFTKEIGEAIGTLEPGRLAQPKQRFAGWYSDPKFNNVVTDQTKLDKSITLYAKYVDTVTVTFAGVTKDAITLDKGQSLDTLAAAEAEEGYRFVGWFMDEKGTNPFVPTEPINEDTTIYAIFVKQIKITVVNENGDELELILDEGQTIKDASNYEEYLEFVNRDGKVLDGVYFEKDGEITYDKANELQYEEDTTVYPCYVFSIKVNGEEYSVDEGEMLGTLGDLSQFTKPGKTIIGFKDSEGNFYEFDYVPTSALNLTVVYEDITDVPNTLDNVQTYMMLLAAGMISILVGLGFVASKKLN